MKRRPTPIAAPSSRPFRTWKTVFPRSRILNEETAVEHRAVDAAQHSLDLSNQRYKGGVTAYLEVITAETTLLNNQRTLTDLQTRQFAASVQLIRSLGGGWDVTQLPK